MKRRTRRSGFTILELIVVVAILSVLAGAAVPVATRAWNAAARRATRQRLDELARSSLAFFRDTSREPRDVLELLERPDDVASWIGPYVAIETRDPALGDHPIALDAWSRPIAIESAPGADSIALVSRGPDGLASEDDLAVEVDFTPARRERTLAAQEEIEAAIERFAARHPGERLPLLWSQARTRLISEGCLDPRLPTERDGWGRPFAADPQLDERLRSAHPAGLRVVSASLLERGL